MSEKVIDKKIVGYEVVAEKKDEPAAPVVPVFKPEDMNETIKRPEVLHGSTYKIKPPETISDYALYVTINDTILNEGTEHEVRRPFEIFINSKNMDDFAWVVTVTTMMSAVFRKGGDVSFLIDELRGVFDPRGGYFRKSKYVPSIPAEIGDVLERHLKSIGYIQDEEMDAGMVELINKKKEQLANKETKSEPEGDGEFPENATVCPKCKVKAFVRMDNCEQCLNCGESKCG